ncbi:MULTISPECIES: ABC transporter permease [unclassified Mesorhizobium]|uniref:ABC transporter permease n=1 Tax=unclassified Mesorhizobium TaxID=325217 RepID=UPI000FD5FABC|nr:MULTISPECIES: ABC transporter permease [unclassified Mesorhizobium]RVB73274.1 ABC transporter permease [Mesorhizobium sp. M6A.T.Cr.TU.014.01.1.1]RWP77565.1 MAG: ABC transporter permease [Mesorhizobium sp.]RWQ02160.1 MAG: ABC transporter permease [Mesorhizobium sp.]RWQ09796.1 MAG: ABC transporter permease [Mesorhizobium sp.]
MTFVSFSNPSRGRVAETAITDARSGVRLLPRKSVTGQRVLGPALVLLVWYAASAQGWISQAKLPGPAAVFDSFLELAGSGVLASDMLMSLQRASIGLLIGVFSGFLLAVLAGLSRLGDSLIDGNIQVKRAIPSLALIPLFIIWLGIGETMKVMTIALGVMVPIYINTHAALRGIDRRYVELGQTLSLSRLGFIRDIVVPASLPGFFTGLRLGVTGAWTALVVVETVNATSGIGYMIGQARTYGQTEVVLLGLIVYGFLGFLSDAVVRLIERRVLSWRQSLDH